MQHIPGPDFPTSGIINGRAGIVQAYKTGRGKIYVRARTTIETDKDSGKQAIIINELPYQVNKARLQEKLYSLLVNLAKIPFTDNGGAIIENGMKEIFNQGRGINLLKSDEGDVAAAFHHQQAGQF